MRPEITDLDPKWVRLPNRTNPGLKFDTEI